MQRSVLLLVAVLLLFTSAARADQPTKPESMAQGILRVVGDPRLADELLTWLPRTPVLKEAIGNVSQDAAAEHFNVAQVVGRKDGSVVDVSVVSFDERVPADKLLEKLAAVLEKKLQSLDAAHQQDEERARIMMKEVDRIGNELRKQQELVSLNPGLMVQRRMQLEAEQQNLGLQLEGLKARRAVIERQIAELGKEVASAVGEERVLRELLKSASHRKKIVEALRAKLAAGLGGVSDEQVLDAEDKLAQAEAEVARFRAQAAQQAGGGRIEELKRRLDDTAIEMAETMGRHEALKKEFEQVWSNSAQVELKGLEVERLKQDYRDAAEELSNLRMKLRLYIPPQVRLVPLE